LKQQQAYRIITAALFLFMLGGTTAVIAQVKVGTNPQSLNADAVLEIESANKGLLLPRLNLTSTLSPAPLSAFVKGMVVYNTATDNDVVPGMYYSDGVKWMKMVAGAIAQAPPSTWSLNGNAGSQPAFNFLGTTDNAALRFRTNNMERMTIHENGYVGIGTTTPSAALEIKGELKVDTIMAGNRGTDNILVAGTDGKVKSISASGFVSGAQKRVEVVATSGQTIFTTPATITDMNKIMLYRNGIQISFTVNNSTSVIAEIPCIAGDEIRIIQLL
jgi:hypothetical protein